MDYTEAVKYLYNLQKFGIKFGLSKTSNLLKALGNPHRGQHYIHIAGTNGKGSVAAFLASVLKQSGLKVGLYTSPHLVRFTERFRINDEEIAPEKAAALISDLKAGVVQEEPPTFFEATTAMALAYFAQEKTDIAIMEVGMGGRLDATNVIQPLVSVITNISMEHQAYLGNRLLDIAGEKAGIIKEGVGVITGVKQPRVLSLIRSICEKKKAPIRRLGRDFRYRTVNSKLHYYGVLHKYNRLRLGLHGRFQARNAALALAVIERLQEIGYQISLQQIRTGLASAVWPGRMHVVRKNPTVILDGSHNPAAIKALADTIASDFKYRSLILVIGIMEDKEIGEMLRKILPLADRIFYTRPVYARAASPEILEEKAAPLKRRGQVIPNLSDALDMALETADPADLIVVCGSLFTVGEALTYFDPATYSPDPV